MAESASFEMLELSTGEVVLRAAGEEDGFLLKVAFDKSVSRALGENKFEICREMMVAGIEAAQELRAREPELLISSELDDKARERLIQYFAKTHSADMNENRVLH